MSLVRQLLLKHGRYSERYEIRDVSYYYLADEIARTQFVADELVQPSRWKTFSAMTPIQFASFLKRTAQAASLARYRKHTRGPKKPPSKRSFNGTRHVATAKILAERAC